VTPVEGQLGGAEVTLLVSDGIDSSSSIFSVSNIGIAEALDTTGLEWSTRGSGWTPWYSGNAVMAWTICGAEPRLRPSHLWSGTTVTRAWCGQVQAESSCSRKFGILPISGERLTRSSSFMLESGWVQAEGCFSGRDAPEFAWRSAPDRAGTSSAGAGWLEAVQFFPPQCVPKVSGIADQVLAPGTGTEPLVFTVGGAGFGSRGFDGFGAV